jgi:hypothetical protein
MTAAEHRPASSKETGNPPARELPDEADVNLVAQSVEEPVEGQGAGGPTTKPDEATRRPDRDAPGAYVDDVTSSDVPEPNEPA